MPTSSAASWNAAAAARPMQARSGTGHLGTRYYYYVCRKPDCGLRVVAEEVEGAILGRVRELAASDGLLERLVDETNRRVSRQKPEPPEEPGWGESTGRQGAGRVVGPRGARGAGVSHGEARGASAASKRS